MLGPGIEEEELISQIQKARERYGRTDVTAEEYAALADEAVQEERFYAAAVLYHLAQSQALPSEKADHYYDRTRHMVQLAAENSDL